MQLLQSLGQIAGIAGIGLGVIFLIFRDAIGGPLAKNLGEQNAYGLLRLVTILSFAAGMAGVAGYVAINLLGDKKPTEKQQTVPLPSGTGWIFAGYFDPQKSQWADEHYVDHAGAPCDPGWIGGKVRIVDKERHIVIVGYKETGWKSYETSPVSSYKEDRDITDVCCRSCRLRNAHT